MESQQSVCGPLTFDRSIGTQKGSDFKAGGSIDRLILRHTEKGTSPLAGLAESPAPGRHIQGVSGGQYPCQAAGRL